MSDEIVTVPTIDTILEATFCLYSSPEEGFSDVDAAAVSSILKAKAKQPRQIFSLWTILKPYEGKLTKLGYDFRALVPPDPFTKETIQSQVKIGATVSLKKIDTKNGQRVAIWFPYDPALVETIKKLKSRSWDKELKTWLIPLTPVDIEMAIATLKAENCTLDVDQELRAIMEQGKVSYKESRAETSDIIIPTKIELYAYQKAGVKWTDDHDGRVLIADEPGLGKTCQALGWIKLRQEKALPALIICPAIVRVHWYREVLNFTDLKPLLIVGKTAAPAFKKAGLEVSDQPLAGYDVTITNYDLLAVETPKTWLRNLLSPKKDVSAYGERHLAWAGLQAKELLANAMKKYQDIDSRNKINRVLGKIEAQSTRARKIRDPEYKIVYVNGVPFEEFVKAGYKTLVADESHYAKDISAQRAVAAIEISSIVQHAICLTGTPIDNRPKELWSQIQIVNKSVAPKFFDFGLRFCGAFQKPAAQGKMVWDFNGVSNIAELDKLLRSTIMIRRTKDQVLKDLPSKTRTMIPFVVDEAGDKIYRKEEAGVIDRLREIRKERQEWKALVDALPETDRRAYVAKHAEKAARASGLRDLAIGEIEKLKEAAVNAKYPECIEYILGLKETQGKILVFGVHHKTIDRLVASFREKGIKAEFIDGRVTGPNRQNIVDAFQTGDIEILVCGIRAASTGLTLTASHTVVFVELDWAPGVHEQAEKRVDRIGQSKPVTIYYLLLLNSLEEKIAKMIDAKREVVNSILGEGDRTVQEAGILDAVLDELLDGEKVA